MRLLEGGQMVNLEQWNNSQMNTKSLLHILPIFILADLLLQLLRVMLKYSEHPMKRKCLLLSKEPMLLLVNG